MDIKASGEQALSGSSLVRQRQDFSLKGAGVGRDLSSYRRTALPTRGSAAVGGGVEKGRGVVPSFGETLFRSRIGGGNIGSRRGNNLGGGEGGGLGGRAGGIGGGQRAAALRQTGSVFSEKFLSRNPLLSPGPGVLPSLEVVSAGGGVVGLPNGEIGGGGLSGELLRALQKYRVAAEVQG